jgi:hypothetical protein
MVRAEWVDHFEGAGLGDAEIRRFATCFRQAELGRERLTGAASD